MDSSLYLVLIIGRTYIAVLLMILRWEMFN